MVYVLGKRQAWGMYDAAQVAFVSHDLAPVKTPAALPLQEAP
jgi:hypothetical protein